MKKIYAVFAVISVLVVGGAAVLLFGDGTPSYTGFARDGLKKLTVVTNPPPQPQTPFSDSEGETYKLQDFRGRVILVNLWATWCPPCLEELPGLDTLAEAFEGKGFDVLAISVDRDFADAEAFLKDLGVTHLKPYSDPKFALAAALKTRGVPVTVLYDRKGRELARLEGGGDWNSKTAHALVRQALKESS